MKQWIVLGVSLLLLVMASNAPAQTRAGLLKEAEASMLLTGRIDVAADGSVTGYSIDRHEEVPPEVLAHIERNVPRWQVHPATRDGVPVASSSRFSMRLVARRGDARDFTFNIAGVHIRDGRAELRHPGGSMAPPAYPLRVAKAGGTGTVYLLLKVGRDGRVIDSHVERFNLSVLAQRPTANMIEGELSRAALRAASTWSLNPGVVEPGADHVVIRVPVDFTLDDRQAYGAWSMYIPGAYTRAPWAREDEDGNDALMPGSAVLAGSGLRLASALEPDGS